MFDEFDAATQPCFRPRLGVANVVSKGSIVFAILSCYGVNGMRRRNLSRP